MPFPRFPAATDEHCIVYNDAALDRLLDRSQQGMEEKQLEMNDYLSSFKVAHYEKREIQDGDDDYVDEDDSNVEVWMCKKAIRFPTEMTWALIWSIGSNYGIVSKVNSVHNGLAWNSNALTTALPPNNV